MLDGWRLHALTAQRKPRDFKPEEVDALLRAFPKLPSTRLGQVLGASGETSRRAEYLASRLDTHAPVVSLDDRPMPARGSVSPKDASALPRLYAGVDEARGVLNVFASEYQFGALGGGRVPGEGVSGLRPAGFGGAGGRARTSEEVFSFLADMSAADRARIAETFRALEERLEAALRRAR